VKGKRIGIDATTLEANAALRSIVRRDNGESYEEFLKGLARESGIETPTREDLARVDRKRKKKGSNQEWVNPHDPDARISKMKDGSTHMAHKAEHAVDMETGAVVAVTLQEADLGDTATVKETLAEAGAAVAELIEREAGTRPLEEPQVNLGGIEEVVLLLVCCCQVGSRRFPAKPASAGSFRIRTADPGNGHSMVDSSRKPRRCFREKGSIIAIEWWSGAGDAAGSPRFRFPRIVIAQGGWRWPPFGRIFGMRCECWVGTRFSPRWRCCRSVLALASTLSFSALRMHFCYDHFR